MIDFLRGKETLLLEGLMPERALLRLKRRGIPVYNVEKRKKNQILFQVNEKDSEKVFAIYPNVCYNNCVYSPYFVQRMESEGIRKYIQLAKRRVGILLGGLLCVVLVLLADPLIFGVEFSGTDIYAREAVTALEEAGITLFSPYVSGREDMVCAKLLSLPDVEFCSVKKVGHRVVVEVRTSPFPTPQTKTGSMQAQNSGRIVGMTVLRGSPLKKLGDTIARGDVLVGDWFEDVDGGQVRVEIIARVRIACTWAGEIEAASAEEAFAKAYLALELSPTDVLTSRTITENNGLYLVSFAYERVERWNL